MPAEWLRKQDSTNGKPNILTADKWQLVRYLFRISTNSDQNNRSIQKLSTPNQKIVTTLNNSKVTAPQATNYREFKWAFWTLKFKRPKTINIVYSWPFDDWHACENSCPTLIGCFGIEFNDQSELFGTTWLQPNSCCLFWSKKTEQPKTNNQAWMNRSVFREESKIERTIQMVSSHHRKTLQKKTFCMRRHINQWLWGWHKRYVKKQQLISVERKGASLSTRRLFVKRNPCLHKLSINCPI